MTALLEMEKRHARRCQKINESKQIKPPTLSDCDSLKEHNKILKDLQSDFLNECFLVDTDFRVLVSALRRACERVRPALDAESLCDEVWREQRLEPEVADILNRRKMEEAEAREKEFKKNGKIADIPGQTKLFDPDSFAEAAGPVTVTRFDPSSSLTD